MHRCTILQLALCKKLFSNAQLSRSSARSKGSSLLPGYEGPTSPGEDSCQLRSQEDAQPASCLLLLLRSKGFCSVGDAPLQLCGLLLPPNGQRAESPFAADHGVTGCGDWFQRVPVC